MADNVTLPLTGTGDTTAIAATDDSGTGHVQLVKLTLSADGSRTHLTADADGMLVNLGANNDVTVTGSVTANAGTNLNTSALATSAKQDTLLAELQLKADLTETQPVSLATVPSHAVTNAGVFVVQENGAALTALQLIDDTVQVLGTDTYTEATSKGITLGAVRRDTDTTLVGTTNEFGPLQMDANGRLKVEAFSGETLPVSLTSTTITGSVDTELPTAAAISAENTAAPTAPSIYNFPLLFDGANWDRAPGTSVDGALVNLGTNNDVTITSGTVTTVSTVTAVTTVTNPVTVAGGAAHASPVSGNPVLNAGRASNAIPTDVGADGDVASLWTNRNGAQVTVQAPHVGLNGDPWTLLHEGVQFTSAQTSTIVIDAGAGDKIVVTQVQIQAFSTTAGTAILYFGTGAFARGTNRAVFDGDFTPSATLKPGVIMTGPFIAGANGDDLRFTSVGDVDVTLSIWYYLVT